MFERGTQHTYSARLFCLALYRSRIASYVAMLPDGGSMIVKDKTQNISVIFNCSEFSMKRDRSFSSPH